MNYEQSLEFLYSQLPMFSRVGAAAYKPGLDNTIALDKLYSNPHRNFKSIHIAGTNGKGSTSHLLAATLQAQGYKVGLYTSPHLVDFRERIKINGKMIPRENVAQFVNDWQKRSADVPELHPSFFELTMMMAFDWFAQEKVDYAVIEVGMGGRLDSTNVITPIGCVITNISKDHTQFLGSTLAEIAAEKAGIIKSGIPVVVGETLPETKPVFSKKAEEVGAPIVFAEDKERSAECPLCGDYQKRNINTALAAIEMLRDCGVELSDTAVAEGFRDVLKLTGLQGRWMKLSDKPLTICDTGHNEAGLNYNMGQLRRIMSQRPGAKLRMVVGFVADKAIGDILPLFPKDAVYYFTNAAIPRALPVADLAKRAAEAGLKGEAFGSVGEAYEAAKSEADDNDLIFIGGSTFIVADLLAYLQSSEH